MWKLICVEVITTTFTAAVLVSCHEAKKKKKDNLSNADAPHGVFVYISLGFGLSSPAKTHSNPTIQFDWFPRIQHVHVNFSWGVNHLNLNPVIMVYSVSN